MSLIVTKYKLAAKTNNVTFVLYMYHSSSFLCFPPAESQQCACVYVSASWCILREEKQCRIFKLLRKETSELTGANAKSLEVPLTKQLRCKRSYLDRRPPQLFCSHPYCFLILRPAFRRFLGLTIADITISLTIKVGFAFQIRICVHECVGNMSVWLTFACNCFRTQIPVILNFL